MKPWLRIASGLLLAACCGAVQSQEVDALRERIQQQDAQLRDWPNLARYRADNAALPPARAGEHRVVFIGDSITDSWGREAGEFFTGRAYVNRGISAQTTPQMLLRFRADVIALQPAAVVILAGTNDIAGNTGPMTPEQTRDNLASMAELARAHRIAVVMATLLPVTDIHAPQTRRRPPARIAELNAWLRAYCVRTGCELLDYHEALADREGALRADLTGDGLHPNARGYAVMGPLAQRAIDRALRRRSR